MAYDLGIDSKDLERIVGLFKEAGAGAVAMADGVDKVNQSMGQMRTVGGRSVRAASNPSDAPLGLGNAPDVVGPRRPFAGERDFIGPVPDAPGPRPMDLKGGRSASLDPYDYEGPRQRLRRYEAMRDKAQGIGDADLTADWEDRVANAQRTVDRLDGNNGGLGQLLQRALMRSRVNLGPLSPLIMDLAPMLGEAGMAAAGGLGAIAGLAMEGGASMRHANQAFYTMGGSPGGVGAAMALGGEHAAEKAMAFGEALRQGSYGSAYFRSKGINDVGPAQIDKSTNYVRALDELRGVSSINERIRIARDTGLTDDLWTSDLSESSYRRLKRSRADAGTPENRRNQAEYQAMQEEASGWWDGVKQTAFEGLWGITRDTKAVLWDLPGAWANGDDQAGQDALNRLNEDLNPWAPGNPWGPKKTANPTASKAKGGGWQNVDPVPTDRTSSGGIGSAVPVGWRGRAMNDYLDSQRMLFGGFST